MTKTIRFDKEQLDRAKTLRDDHKNEREYRAALVFIFMAEKRHTAEETADFFGIGLRTVYKDLDRIRKPEAIKKGEWGGGRNYLMSYEEEAQFLEEFEKRAKEGIILTMPELHREYNLLVGKETPRSTFYRLLKRHQWRKAPTDGRRPKGDPIFKEDWKKKHSKWNWKKLT